MDPHESSPQPAKNGWRVIRRLPRNWVAQAGITLAIVSGGNIVLFTIIDLIGTHPNPYIGILAYIVAPAILIFSFVLIAVGWWLERKHRNGGLAHYPCIDLKYPEQRKVVLGFAAFFSTFALISAGGSYKAYEYTDSAQFCGLTCHTVMQPEYTAYSDSPHSRVSCVECHIGPGASWFVRSKLSGVRQVFAVSLHTYSRPIPSPVAALRPARGTCEQCHWPQRFSGNMLLIRTHYQEDEGNTPTKTVLLMRVGGLEASGMAGIHGHHLDPGVQISYIATDAKRQIIPQVSYVDPSGKKTVFTSTDAKVTPQQLAQGEHRVMDCVDCHNRPTHIFQLPPQALDQAMSESRVSPEVPFIKKEALLALKQDYPDRETATRRIAESLTSFYQKNYPAMTADQHEKLEASIRGVQQIYLHNVFPKMKVTWGTYINNLGHTDDWPGCFRCHDGSHTSADGQTIPNDCDTCHELLAVDEKDPKILSELGMK